MKNCGTDVDRVAGKSEPRPAKWGGKIPYSVRGRLFVSETLPLHLQHTTRVDMALSVGKLGIKQLRDGTSDVNNQETNSNVKATQQTERENHLVRVLHCRTWA